MKHNNYSNHNCCACNQHHQNSHCRSCCDDSGSVRCYIASGCRWQHIVRTCLLERTECFCTDTVHSEWEEVHSNGVCRGDPLLHSCEQLRRACLWCVVKLGVVSDSVRGGRETLKHSVGYMFLCKVTPTAKGHIGSNSLSNVHVFFRNGIILKESKQADSIVMLIGMQKFLSEVHLLSSLCSQILHSVSVGNKLLIDLKINKVLRCLSKMVKWAKGALQPKVDSQSHFVGIFCHFVCTQCMAQAEL